MKKLNAKFIASAVLAAVVATSAAVSASAADYAEVPSYSAANVTSVTGNTSTSTSTNTSTDTATTDEKDNTESTGAAVVSDAAVEAAITSGKAIEVTDDATVQESAIGKIAAGDKAVTFDVDDADGIDYSITIDPALITEVKAINLAMDIEADSDGIVITPAQKGEFGMTLQITIPAAAVADVDPELAEVYYVADDGTVTLVPGALTVNADGSFIIAISHASYYVISDIDLTAGEVDAGIDIDDDDDTDVTIDDTTTDNGTSTGKDDTSVVVNGNGSDSNPITGTTLALGSLAVFAAAAVATFKKRK